MVTSGIDTCVGCPVPTGARHPALDFPRLPMVCMADQYRRIPAGTMATDWSCRGQSGSIPVVCRLHGRPLQWPQLMAQSRPTLPKIEFLSGCPGTGLLARAGLLTGLGRGQNLAVEPDQHGHGSHLNHFVAAAITSSDTARKRGLADPWGAPGLLPRRCHVIP